MSGNHKAESVYLVLPAMEYEEAFKEMLIEFEEAKERLYPRALRPKGVDFKCLLKKLDSYAKSETCPTDSVPSDTYFLVDKHNKLLGAITIRHYLNKELLKFDGHIGYGIRPTERRKGYAKIMLKMALHICKDMEMKRVLVTCNKDNAASAKTIIANGGVFENEMIEDNGTVIERYWIEL